MVNRDAVQEAVEAVLEPDLRRPLGEIGIVREIDVKRRGAVQVGIGVPTPQWAADRLGAAIAEAAKAVEGVGEVDVQVAFMDTAEQAGLASRLRLGSPEKPGAQGSRTRVVTIGSGKGGVGKSSVTANTAVSLARMGHDVAVIDADVGGSDHCPVGLVLEL